ncbi:MAG TPA: reverse transcriptase-like protein [Candidatus Omnitrophota bacterium]|nr:reverse transcriptase-like protein [Candidatus Omnitrophota bacterium]
MKLRTYSDGGARGNPGPGGIGILICDARDKVLAEHRDVIGTATNNVAEYCALIAALSIAKEFGADEVEAFLDSELVVCQMSGKYKVKSDSIRELVGEVRKLEREFKTVSYRHLPREHSRMREADRLVNQALDAGN